LLGRDVSQLSDDRLRNLVAELERRFRDEALTSAARAATTILYGVKADRWRILVGADAHKVDEMVRQSPERAYDIAFFDEFAPRGGVDRAPLSRVTHIRAAATSVNPCTGARGATSHGTSVPADLPGCRSALGLFVGRVAGGHPWIADRVLLAHDPRALQQACDRSAQSISVMVAHTFGMSVAPQRRKAAFRQRGHASRSIPVASMPNLRSKKSWA
jgi:hypothetical protein